MGFFEKLSKTVEIATEGMADKIEQQQKNIARNYERKLRSESDEKIKYMYENRYSNDALVNNAYAMESLEREYRRRGFY